MPQVALKKAEKSMKRLILICTILLTFIAGQGFAANPAETVWTMGNKLYQAKMYDSAAACFEMIVAGKPNNPVVYYNLGNSYYRANKVALAILNYQRALHLNPDMKEAKDNLILAQARISAHIAQVEDIFFVKWWTAITKNTNANMWTVLSFVVFILIILSIGTRYLHLLSFKLPLQIPLILGIFWCVLFTFAYFATQNMKDTGMAVVMYNDTPLMGAEMKPGKQQSLLPEGVTVKIIGNKGSYLEIQTPDGRKGWVDQSAITKI